MSFAPSRRSLHGLILLALSMLLGAYGLAAGAEPDAEMVRPEGPGAAEAVPGVPSVRVVASCSLHGTVDGGSAAYLVDCVRRAETGGYEALLVRIDTPGGALDATREIVQAFLGAKIPVLVWIGPSGARAGSAGVFLTLASHVAAMAPGTNIGAAHPVLGGGEDPEKAGKHMAEKVVNDTSAFAEAIANQRGRNAEWAVAAVRDSVSVTADEAVRIDVVDLLAGSERELLDRVEGRTVELDDGPRILRTQGARVEPLEPSARQRFVHWLANPAIAYILFLVGGLGIAIELAHPGGIAPGLFGAICLVLAMIAFSSLPIQAGGVILILFGLGMIVAELFVASGLLGVGGVALLILGGVLLVDRFDTGWFVDRSFGISWALLGPTAILLGGAAIYVILRAAEARKMPQRGGDAGLIGEVGRTLSTVDDSGGEVFVHGERWRAVSDRAIAPDVAVKVLQVDGLLLTVEEEGRDGRARLGGNSGAGSDRILSLRVGSEDRQ